MTEEHEALERLWGIVCDAIPRYRFDSALEDYQIVAAGLGGVE